MDYAWLGNRRNLIVLLSVIAFLLSILLFVYLPLAGLIRKKNLEWNTLKRQLEIAQINLSVIQESGAKRKLIRKKEAIKVLDKITQQGRVLHLDFNSINQKETRPMENKCLILPVEMEIEGGYEELGRFLGVLENLEDCLLTIESFKVWRNENNLYRLSASLTLNLYLAKD